MTSPQLLKTDTPVYFMEAYYIVRSFHILLSDYTTSANYDEWTDDAGLGEDGFISTIYEQVAVPFLKWAHSNIEWQPELTDGQLVWLPYYFEQYFASEYVACFGHGHRGVLADSECEQVAKKLNLRIKP